MESILHVRDLTVYYGSRCEQPVTALNHVSFELAAGEALGILGESGCGKSTLALALLGLLPNAACVQDGTIISRGTNLSAASEREWQKLRGAEISLIHQEPGAALNPVLRVGEQVAEVLRAHAGMSSKNARQRAKELLTQVGLAAESRMDQAFPHQLSGGQRQRVGIAQAIACHPAMIIADEPTTALDAATQLEIIALLRCLQQQLNLALILIAHDPAALLPIAHRIMVMYAGQIVEEGPTQQILANPLHPYTRALLHCQLPTTPEDLRTQPLTSIPGEPPNLAELPAGCAFAPRCTDRMDMCDGRRPLETHPENGRRVRCFKYGE